MVKHLSCVLEAMGNSKQYAMLARDSIYA